MHFGLHTLKTNKYSFLNSMTLILFYMSNGVLDYHLSEYVKKFNWITKFGDQLYKILK